MTRRFSLSWMLVLLPALGGCAPYRTASLPSPTALSPPPTAAPATFPPTLASPGLLPSTSEPTTIATACTLPATAPDAEGPFYKAGAPERSSLLEPGMGGTPLSLTGRVLTTDCAPIPGAILDFWQADSQGAYDNIGYRLRGRLAVATDGAYRLETIVPGLYPGRPAHIHVKVTLPSGRVLTTQIYFEGQAFGSAERLVDPSLVARLEPSPDGGLQAEFNFVLEDPG